MVSPAYDVIPYLPLVTLLECLICNHSCEVLELPTFVPNEYLYQTHRDKVDRSFSQTWHQEHTSKDTNLERQASWQPERWEIYAWAIRDIMSKAGGLIKNDMPIREKLEYEAQLGYGEPRKQSQKVLPEPINTQ